MRSVHISVVLALLVVTGCAIEHTSDPCVEDLRPGSFELDVIPIPNFDIAGRMELARDGTFVGHPAFAVTGCVGTLTADEQRTLLADIQDARLPCERGRLDSCWGTEHMAVRDIRIHLFSESGAVTGCNALRFVGPGCGTPLDRLVENLERGPLARVYREGGCTEERRYEYTDAWGGSGEPQHPPLPTCE